MLKHPMLRTSLVIIPLLLAYIAVAARPEIEDGFFKTSDGVRLHYREAGRGPGLLFEPGWTMPAWIWDAQLRHFAEHYHVVALDPRSHGDSDKRSDGNSPERRAQDIDELIKRRNLSPVVLVGWSLGVNEVLTYAEQFGGSHVRAYVLVDGFVSDKQDPKFISLILGLYQQMQTDRRGFTEKFVRSMYKKPQPEDYIARVMAASMKMPTDTAVAVSVSTITRTGLAPSDSPSWTDQCSLPAKLLQRARGRLDQIHGPAGEGRTVRHAGHALFVDESARTRVNCSGLHHRAAATGHLYQQHQW